MTRGTSYPIPRTRLIRRLNAKNKWHIDAASYPTLSGKYPTMCGQSFKPGGSKTTRSAKDITCTDCIVAAITNPNYAKR